MADCLANFTKYSALIAEKEQCEYTAKHSSYIAVTAIGFAAGGAVVVGAGLAQTAAFGFGMLVAKGSASMSARASALNSKINQLEHVMLSSRDAHMAAAADRITEIKDNMTLRHTADLVAELMVINTALKMLAEYA